MGKTKAKTGANGLSAAQKAAIEKLKILIKEIAFARFPSFLYTQNEIMRKIDSDLSRLDHEYIDKHNIPANVMKEMARGIYEELMEKGEYDRAITLADHYKL